MELKVTPTRQARRSNLVGCLRLLTQYLRLTPASGGRLLHSQPETAPCWADSFSLNTELPKALLEVSLFQFWTAFSVVKG
jgi:hypothetical protein